MSFLTRDSAGLWAVFKTYVPIEGDGVTITLIPMVHIGESDFFIEAKNEAFCHDVALYENGYVPLRFGLSWANKLFSWRTGLSQQSKFRKGDQDDKALERSEFDGALVRYYTFDLPFNQTKTVKQIVADPGKKLFWNYFKTQTFRSKLELIFVPILYLFLLPFASRRKAVKILAEKQGIAQPSGYFSGFYDYVLDYRDQFLIKRLRHEIENRSASPTSICVKFGAGHMPELEKALLSLGFRPATMRKVLVIKAHKNSEAVGPEYGYGQAWNRIHTTRLSVKPMAKSLHPIPAKYASK